MYIQMMRSYDVRDIQNMQRTQEWKFLDYVKSAIAKGNKDFEKILYYQKKYGFYPTTIATALSGMKHYRTRHCMQGVFIVTEENEAKAVEMFEKFAELKEAIGKMSERYYDVFAKFFKLERYDHNRMLKQLKYFDKLYKAEKCRMNMSKIELADFLEKVYNHQVQAKDKVQLDYKYII